MQNSYAIRPAINPKAIPRIMYGGREFPDYPLVIGDMPADERPREKLLATGPDALTTRELAIIVMISGTSKESITEMTDRIFKEYGEYNVFEERNPTKLAEKLDIPLVKACQIVAVGELGRRTYDRSKTSSITIKNAKDVYEYLADMRNLPTENFRALFLNTHNRIIRDQVLSIGSVNTSLITAREVFNPAIEYMAAAVVIAHNHPSGELAASSEDVTMTERLVQAGKILGIHLLDHVIITKEGFVSVPVNYH